MRREMFSKNNGISILMLSSLLLLPSCGLIDWIKDKFGGGDEATSEQMGGNYGVARSDSSDVLATIGGKPLITKDMLDVEKQRLIESNPQLQAMIALMDEKQLDRNLLDGLASREVIRKYIKDNRVQQSDKYKKDFETVLNQVRDALNTRYFMEAFTEQANDTEVQAYYDENKDTMPNLLISRGGIQAKGVSFKDRQGAKEFATKVKAAKNDIDKAAKDASITDRVKDWRLVNDESIGLEDELKTRIGAIKSFPRVEVVKVGSEYWTIAASRREDAKYRPLEQVKAELKQAIEKEKTMKRFEQEVARLKDEYQIRINETFFAEAPSDNAAALTAENEEVSLDEIAALADASDTRDEATRTQESSEHSQAPADTTAAQAEAPSSATQVA